MTSRCSPNPPLRFSFKNIIKYIDDQYEKYLQDESGLNRRNIVDNRVHCCFYFINPAGHRSASALQAASFAICAISSKLS